MKSVIVSAPSNIALIKYMGKLENSGNRPTNASFSYTLENLRTFVRLTQISVTESASKWKLLQEDSIPHLQEMKLSEKGQARFLKFFELLKQEMNLQGEFLIESANNFPSDCGLASSASSFAALTKAAYEFNKTHLENSWVLNKSKQILATLASSDYAHKIIKQDKIQETFVTRELSKLSRQGSGSSCRSLVGPWGLWADDHAEAVSNSYNDLIAMAVIVEETKKLVSSSEAHVRVTTSPFFGGRPERAEHRLEQLLLTLQFHQWKKAYEICWEEFMDMHDLFHTSQPSFYYMNEDSKAVLESVRQVWAAKDDGPLVTMDAGANVHLLFRKDQKPLVKEVATSMKKLGYKYHLSTEESQLL